MSNNKYNKMSNQMFNKLSMNDIEIALNKSNERTFGRITLDKLKVFQMPKSTNLFKISDYKGDGKFKLSYQLNDSTLNQMKQLKELLVESCKKDKDLKKCTVVDFVKEYNDKQYINLKVLPFTKFGKYENKKVELNTMEDFNYHQYASLLYIDFCVVNKLIYVRFNVKEVITTKDIVFEKKEQKPICMIDLDEDDTEDIVMA